MRKPNTWAITTSGQPSLAEVRRTVLQVGGALQSSLDELGVLLVQGSATQAAAWRKLAGVVAVEAEQAVDVGPPGGDPA
jgi:hypothetical protein